MSENQEVIKTKPEKPQEIATFIAKLEQYRQRIINDTMAMVKRAKILKATTLANLENHPKIAKIDAILADLHSRHQATLEIDSTAS